jgi:hypothetical protein
MWAEEVERWKSRADTGESGLGCRELEAALKNQKEAAATDQKRQQQRVCVALAPLLQS